MAQTPGGRGPDDGAAAVGSTPLVRVGRAVARGLLRVASWPYALGARLHRRLGRRRSAVRGRPACAIVSVGGLTVGGAGKTPIAARLARALQDRGHRVVLASRGYRGASRAPVCVVSDGRRVLSSVAQSGEESLLLASQAPGVPVLCGRDRRVVGHHAVAAFDAQILVLDDGFQHHRLARDLDLVCLDGPDPLGNGRVLPAGPLREPASSLAAADWLCLVDAETDAPGGASAIVGATPAHRPTSALDAILEAHRARGGRVLRARRRAEGLVSLDRRRHESLDWLKDRRVGLLCALGRPETLRRTLRGLGARIVAERLFRDHHDYRPRDLRDLDVTPEAWITSEKDALKIQPDWPGERVVLVLESAAEIDDEAAVLDALEAWLRERGRLDRGSPINRS